MVSYTEHRLQNRTGLKLYYRHYGSKATGLPVVCLPGITRNSRDFHEIATHLGARHPVVTMDFRGRGFSDWDPQWRNYQPATYPGDVLEILDHLAIDRFVLLGTSLGGIVSMLLAKSHPERIQAIILNDICPEIGAEGLARIKNYIGRAVPVSNWSEAVAQARETYALAWPGLSDEEWLVQARRGYREDANGVPVLDMDPKVGDAARVVSTSPGDPWQLFEDIACKPVLVLHGKTSDILTFDLVERMRAIKPDLVHVVVENRGHTPILNEPECIDGIDHFLAEHGKIR